MSIKSPFILSRINDDETSNIRNTNKANIKQEAGLDYDSDTTILSSTNSTITETNEATPPNDPFINSPICFVDGFLCSSNINIWQDMIVHFRKSASIKKRACPEIYRLNSGGVSSAYDTAISIFYQIKGGKEDYGEIHSKNHYHSRFGEEHKGVYTKWDEQNPVHLCGHSFGGNIILLLQKLLDDKIFYDQKTGERYDTNSSWIYSITTISSPLRGSTGTLFLGHKVNQPGHVDLFSFGRLLYGIGHVWEYLDFPHLKSLFFDFRLSHFNLNHNKSIFNLLKRALTLEVFEKGIDTAAYDISIERCLVAPLKTFNNTYYRSYCAKLTTTDPDTKYEIPIQHWCLPLVLLSQKIGKFDLKVDGKGKFKDYEKEQALWRSNDGLVPLISQFHPGECSSDLCQHFNFEEELDKKQSNESYFDNIKTGYWYTTTVNGCSHIDLIPCVDPPLMDLWKKIGTYFMSNSEEKLPSYQPETIQTYRNMLFEDYENYLIKIENSKA